MGFLTEHPYTAITTTIDRAVSSKDYSLEVELENIVDLIGFRDTVNQEEAARALRKKLKYGSKLKQSRSLDLLDLFISQEFKFSVLYNDDKLLDRLEVIALDSNTDGNGQRYDSRIVAKCAQYMIQWYEHIADIGKRNTRTFGRIADICLRVKKDYRRKKAEGSGSSSRRKNRRNDFLDDQADPFETIEDCPSSGGRSSSGKNALTQEDKLYRIPRIDVKKHAPKIKIVISDALAAAVALKHSLLTLPAGKYSTNDLEATENFNKARLIRKKVLAYLQVITDGEFLGSLIQANDELVAALTEYDEKSDKLGQGEPDDEDDDFDDDEEDSVAYEDSDDDDGRAPSIYSVPQSTASNPFGDHNEL
ncbi:LAS seventeen-binding protein 5 [Nakaseomyces bracarensis]|uniref:LAS seventeen-binding protein 5 n=1 Tax=Nakaseomyces bracarensis TaxID=273131 RepID=A0ABR4NYJ5_9SACH